MRECRVADNEQSIPDDKRLVRHITLFGRVWTWHESNDHWYVEARCRYVGMNQPCTDGKVHWRCSCVCMHSQHLLLVDNEIIDMVMND